MSFISQEAVVQFHVVANRPAGAVGSEGGHPSRQRSLAGAIRKPPFFEYPLVMTNIAIENGHL